MTNRASNRQGAAGGGGNTRVDFVMFHVDGDAPAIVDKIVSAMRANGYTLPLATPRPPAVTLPAPSTNGAHADGQAADAAGTQMTLDAMQNPAPPQVNGEEAGTPAAARPPRARTNPRPPKILDDLKAHEEPGGFKSFVAGRNVDSDNKKGLVAAIWLKDHGVIQFNIDHVNTCFSMVKWQLPDDPGSLLRNMARPKCGLLRHAGKPGLYELTAKGVNEYAAIV